MILNEGKDKKDYRSRLDVIRNPGMNHMSRTRTKIDRFKTNGKDTVKKGPRRKKKAYDGAYVAEPRRQKSSGFSLAGQLMTHIHNFVIDMDLTSLYPSIMLLCNLSPVSFIGKVILQKQIEIPMYQIKFIDGDEKSEYKNNANDFLFESYIGKHWWAIFEIFCGMKTSDAIMDHIAENFRDFT